MEKPKVTSQINFEQRQLILKRILQSPQTLYPFHSGSKGSIVTGGQILAGALLETYSQQENISQIAEDFSATVVTTLAGVDTLLRTAPQEENSIHKDCIKLKLIWESITQDNPQLTEQIQGLLQPAFISLQYGLTPEEAEITSNNFTLLIKNTNSVNQ